MYRSRNFFLIASWCTLGLLPSPAGAHSPKTPPTASGAYYTGVYENLFRQALFKSDDDVSAKVSQAFAQLFHGDSATQSIYYPVGSDKAYIEDILHNDVRTEGMSYGMMIAVQLDKKNEFDRLWNWAKTYMQHRSGPHKNFFAWHCATDGTKLDLNAASDGEEWFVTSLLFASARWGNGSSIYNYNAEAQTILRTMLHKEEEPGGSDSVTNMFNRKEHQVVFVPSIEAAGFTDPSYHLPHFYELWARWADEDRGFWCTAASVSRAFLKKAAHPVTGLSPEYAHFDGTPILPWGNGSKDFRYDAWRVAMNVAVDHSWFAKDPWAVGQSDRLLAFFHRQGIGTYGTFFTLDGDCLLRDRSTGLIAMNSVACLASALPERKEFLEEFWNTPVPSGPGRYYDGMLYMLALLQDSGNFKIFDPTHAVIPKCSENE
jgi:oligosaccharide reducing-end xylanase